MIKSFNIKRFKQSQNIIAIIALITFKRLLKIFERNSISNCPAGFGSFLAAPSIL
jgi:hypothetical protein